MKTMAEGIAIMAHIFNFNDLFLKVICYFLHNYCY